MQEGDALVTVTESSEAPGMGQATLSPPSRTEPLARRLLNEMPRAA